MNDHDDDLSDLFGRERRAHPAAPAAKARVWSRLEASLGPNGGGGGTPASAAPAPLAPPASRLFAKIALAACCILGAGGALYSQLPADPGSAAIRIPATADRTPRTLSLAAGSTKAVDAVEPPATAALAHIESAPAVTAVTEPACAICDEQRVLDPGRRGLREKHYDEALAAIADHQSRFPNGQLAEERESLRVHVLVAMGRARDAADAKSDFRRAFPASPLLDSVDHAGDTQ